MSRKVRILLAVVGVICMAAALSVRYVSRAMRQVQPFYQAALEVDPQALAGANQTMESRVAALYSDATHQTTWQAAFSDTEVNGWLAVTLGEKYPDLLPEHVEAPRVAFTAGEVVAGFRYRDEHWNSVISVRAEAFVADTDLVGVRLLGAHAGTLPIPLAKVVEYISTAARKQGWALRWTQQEGDPVALIPLAGALSTASERRRLETVELHDGELYLAGKTLPANEAKLADQPVVPPRR